MLGIDFLVMVGALIFFFLRAARRRSSGRAAGRPESRLTGMARVRPNHCPDPPVHAQRGEVRMNLLYS